MSVAKRVSDEVGVELGEEVGYSIRYIILIVNLLNLLLKVGWPVTGKQIRSKCSICFTSIDTHPEE